MRRRSSRGMRAVVHDGKRKLVEEVAPVDSMHVDARKACLLHELGCLHEVGHLGLDVFGRKGTRLARRIPHDGEFAGGREPSVAPQTKGKLHEHLGAKGCDARVDLLACAHEGSRVVEHRRRELLKAGINAHAAGVDEAKATLRAADVVVDAHLREAAVGGHVKAWVHGSHSKAVLDGGLADGEGAGKLRELCGHGVSSP